MKGMKTISVTDRSQHEVLHIELPGCVVNIYHRLTDGQGRPVVRVSVTADRYAGEAVYGIDGDPEVKSHAVSVVRIEAGRAG